MLKLSSLTKTLFVGLATGLLLVGSAQAQRGSPAVPAARSPARVGSAGLPSVRPPADHPALAGQPLVDIGKLANVAMRKAVEVVPETRGVKKAGLDLKKAVTRVKALDWHKLDKAEAEAANGGKPILLLQTLGDIGGFA